MMTDSVYPPPMPGQPERFGKFELLDEIGHGGMATVHRAVLRGTAGFERQVVIKRILPDLASDEHFVRMFVTEAKLSAQLDHPNIVQIYDFGVIDQAYFIAMEFIEGISLLNFIKRRGRRNLIPPIAAAYISHQVCQGLDYAHKLTRDGRPLGLVHRDVSPANVMLSTHGVVKVLDFGIAKAVEAIEAEHTRTGTLKGKWSYMSPEQVEGRQITSRSDIFAGGIILWEMLTGRRLFKAKTDYLTLSNVVRARVPPVTSFRPEVPPVFDQICARALARDPDDRYASAEEMGDALEEVLGQQHFGQSQLAGLVEPLVSSGPLRTTSGGFTGSASGSAVGFRVPTEESESVSSLAKGEQALLDPDGPRSRWTIPAIIGGTVALALIVVTGLLVLRPDDDTGTAEAAKPAAAAGAAGSADREETLGEVRIKVETKPAGATLTVAGEGKPRGKTPLELSFTRGDGKKKLALALLGHETLEREVKLDKDQQLKLYLEKKSEPSAAKEAQSKNESDESTSAGKKAAGAGGVAKVAAKGEGGDKKPDAPKGESSSGGSGGKAKQASSSNDKPDASANRARRRAAARRSRRRRRARRAKAARRRSSARRKRGAGKKGGKEKLPDLMSGGLADPYD